jgi:hypothetical protein
MLIQKDEKFSEELCKTKEQIIALCVNITCQNKKSAHINSDFHPKRAQFSNSRNVHSHNVLNVTPFYEIISE